MTLTSRLSDAGYLDCEFHVRPENNSLVSKGKLSKILTTGSAESLFGNFYFKLLGWILSWLLVERRVFSLPFFSSTTPAFSSVAVPRSRSSFTELHQNQSVRPGTLRWPSSATMYVEKARITLVMPKFSSPSCLDAGEIRVQASHI